MRRAAAALALWLTACAAPLTGAELTEARYEVPLDVYPHRIMGDIREKAVLVAVDRDGREYRLDLRDSGPGHNVFEDIAPRVVDATGDGQAEIVVVESSQTEGAQLAIYALRGGSLTKIAATPHIGTRFRWLAPAAIADLNGDGAVEIAFVDRPHLARTLRIWTWAPGGLTEAVALPGLTNHRIGDEVIWGGLRRCGPQPELVLADARFSQIVTIRYDGFDPLFSEQSEKGFHQIFPFVSIGIPFFSDVLLILFCKEIPKQRNSNSFADNCKHKNIDLHFSELPFRSINRYYPFASWKFGSDEKNYGIKIKRKTAEESPHPSLIGIRFCFPSETGSHLTQTDSSYLDH